MVDKRPSKYEEASDEVELVSNSSLMKAFMHSVYARGYTSTLLVAFAGTRHWEMIWADVLAFGSSQFLHLLHNDRQLLHATERAVEARLSCR